MFLVGENLNRSDGSTVTVTESYSDSFRCSDGYMYLSRNLEAPGSKYSVRPFKAELNSLYAEARKRFDQRATETAAIKHDNSKPRVDLLPPAPLLAVAEAMTFGAKKYSDHNWRKGFAWSRLLGASLRHVLAFMGGEDKDPESGLSHLAHAACCILFLIQHEIDHKNLDDRYKPATSTVSAL